MDNMVITQSGYLLVEGIEKWITQLTPLDPYPDIDLLNENDTSILFQDIKTGAVFAIKRVK